MHNRLILTLTLAFAGCVTEPSHNLIEDFVAGENARYAGDEKIDVAKIKQPPMSREKRREALIGKTYDVYIHHMRGSTGVAMVENVEFNVPGCELGDRVKLAIKKSDYGKPVAEVIKPLGRARVEPQGAGVEEGQEYTLEIIGRTPTGDYYGVIGDMKAYVLGARRIGEKIRAKVSGTDRLVNEDVIYMIKKSKPALASGK